MRMFYNEFTRFAGMVDVKGVLHNQNGISTVVITLMFSFLEFTGITKGYASTILILFLMILLDFLVKRTVVGRKFGSIKNARDVNFWRSNISREKLASKTANYCFIIFAVFLMTLPLCMYDINIGFVSSAGIVELLRITSNAILLGIEFDSIMENIKSQFSEEEQKKIDKISRNTKAGTVDIIEGNLATILNKARQESEED